MGRGCRWRIDHQAAAEGRLVARRMLPPAAAAVAVGCAAALGVALAAGAAAPAALLGVGLALAWLAEAAGMRAIDGSDPARAALGDALDCARLLPRRQKRMVEHAVARLVVETATPAPLRVWLADELAGATRDAAGWVPPPAGVVAVIHELRGPGTGAGVTAANRMTDL
jgi:hypothetical protein